jgi:hypothetical protein
MAKLGELKRAAQQLGVTSTTLREQGWSTASPTRVKAVKENPPEWLIKARERRRVKRARQHQLRATKTTAARLGVQVRAVKERGIGPGDVKVLLADPPEWLTTEQQRRQVQIERETKDALRRELTDTLVTSVHEVWFQELKTAATDAEVEEADVRWAPEVDRARREARDLVDELTPDRIRARIDREHSAASQASVYRATRLAQRASGTPEAGRG